jgi:hypothetical protein
MEIGMNPNKPAVRAILTEVAADGAIVISKRKLLMLLGKSHDRPTAWDVLLEIWKELEQPAKSLYGLQVLDKIVLTTSASHEHACIEDKWASGEFSFEE